MNVEVSAGTKGRREAEMEICNRVTGQIVRFLKTGDDSNGDMLEMESVYTPFSEEPPLHYHPLQRECFEVLTGHLAVRMGNYMETYAPGAVVHIPAGVRHSMWNPNRTQTIVNWKVSPAGNTEAFLRTMTALANSGRTNKKGVPRLAVLVYLLCKHKQDFRLVKPSAKVITLLSFLLKPIFKLFDYENRFQSS